MIALRLAGHHIGVVPPKRITTQVRRAIDAAPCSLRELARDAGVPHSTLVRIRSGEREATVDVAQRLARALRAWGTRCLTLADSVERAVESARREV